MTRPCTQITVTTMEDAQPLLYIKLRPGRIVRTRVLIKDTLLADYDKDGNLVAIEIIG